MGNPEGLGEIHSYHGILDPFVPMRPTENKLSTSSILIEPEQYNTIEGCFLGAFFGASVVAVCARSGVG